MPLEILISLIAGIVSLAAGSITATGVFQEVLRRLLGKTAPQTKTYSERLASLTESLTKSTKQVDAVLAELSRVAGERETAVRNLESNLASLEGREKDLKKRIADLQNVPIAAADRFAELLASGEKRSAWRDYILFGAGVIVSTAIAIGLKFAGLG